jgi:hypothetical protein
VLLIYCWEEKSAKIKAIQVWSLGGLRNRAIKTHHHSPAHMLHWDHSNRLRRRRRQKSKYPARFRNLNTCQHSSNQAFTKKASFLTPKREHH